MVEASPDYGSMCFVIMPFGSKPVHRPAVAPGQAATRSVDFDSIYRDIFLPAIEATLLPEGGHLKAFRTDMNPASSLIDVEMFRGIEYARMVLSDISGQNANVFYELGVRHHSRESGTVILRQADEPIPFDISHIKAFPYEYEPQANALKSRELITRVLTESLKQNLITSPIQVALREQRGQPEAVEQCLQTAEERIRTLDPEGAISSLKQALQLAPGNALVHFKIGLLHKYKGQFAQARDSFSEATRLLPSYAEAWRELGIAQNRLWQADERLATGEESLRKAVQLNPKDFDAHASLGGVLRRLKRLPEALREYELAAEVLEGHPYPLLNELKLRVALEGRLELDERTRFHLERAARLRLAQIKNPQPIDSPWCFFDLSEIRLYLGSKNDFLKYLDEGLLQPTTRRWQAGTHGQTLEMLAAAGYNPPGLAEGIEKLKQAAQYLPEDA